MTFYLLQTLYDRLGILTVVLRRCSFADTFFYLHDDILLHLGDRAGDAERDASASDRWYDKLGAWIFISPIDCPLHECGERQRGVGTASLAMAREARSERVAVRL